MMPMSRLDVYQDSKDRFRYRAVSGNHEIFHAGRRSFETKDKLFDHLIDLKSALENEQPRFYVDSRGEHRWDVVTSDGLIADAHEGFTTKSGAVNNHRLVCEFFASLAAEAGIA